jgi:uncharacterized protein
MQIEPQNKHLFWGLAFIAMAIIIGTGVGSYTFYKIKSLDNTLSVTGSAKEKVIADTVKWTSSFSRIVSISDIKSGYIKMAADQTIVLEFLKGQNIEDSAITVSPVMMSEVWNSDNNSPKQYSLSQTVQVQSNDVQGITNMAKNISQITDKGVIFSTNNLEYYYSKLPEARVNLLSDAIKDAQNRADKIASSTGKKVGSLKSASMGVVQVLQENSNDTADYGSYDTSTINKEVMVVVKAEFVLK